MSQEMNIIFLFALSVGAFIYFKINDKGFKNRVKVLSGLGAIFLFVGIIIVLMIHDFNTLIDCLFLKLHKVSGRLIFIGYAFILMSFLFFLDEIVSKILKRLAGNG